MAAQLARRQPQRLPATAAWAVRAVGGRNTSALRGLLPRSLTREGLILDQHIREGRFQRSLALITGLSSALSGLEVLTEHYRGSYSQRIMYTPILLSPALLVAAIWGALDRRAARTVLPAVSLLTLADGAVGFVFHVRGIKRKPGGWRVPIFNLIMGPPVFAPLLFAISGYLGLLAAFLRREDDPRTPRVPAALRLAASPATHQRASLVRWVEREGFMLGQHVREGRFQKQLAAAAAIAAIFSGVEALYSHYKNNFRYLAQWTPIVLTPVLVVAGFGAIVSRTIARTLLPVASLLAMLDGAVGSFYHVRGMLRRPGGLRYPLYNLMYGPPPFAPLLFAATGFLGLLASLLRRAD